MKHLKGFNESSIVNILSDCRDILIDLSDNHIPYKVWVSGSGSIIVQIGDGECLTSLKSMSTTFDHLISYLESIGYLLSKKSFYENSNWEYYECCPHCSSDNIDINDSVFTCRKCKSSGGSEDFMTPEWPLDSGELFYSIKMNYKFDFMMIQFDRVRRAD
jgi:hypothetical protein